MIGLGTYAFFWEHQATLPDGTSNPERLDLDGMLRATAALGVELFQICDYASLLELDGEGIRQLRALADELGIRLEIGTRGIGNAHLDRMLGLAADLGATLVRSMLYDADSRPTIAEAEVWLRSALPAWEAAGVTLALETYEQVPVEALVELVARIDSAALGICLDPANCVAALEHPRDTVERCAPFVRNIHIKDFAFSRRDGWVGFTLAGAPLGHGLLDYEHLDRVVEPAARGIHRIIEHWLPWQGTLAETIRLERDWTSTTLTYLKEH